MEYQGNYAKSKMPKPPKGWQRQIQFTHDFHEGSGIVEYYDVWFFKPV